MNIVHYNLNVSAMRIANMGQETSIRVRSALAMSRLTRWFLALLIITLPWRSRVVLFERALPPIYQDFTDLLAHLPELFLVGLLGAWGICQWTRPRRLHTGPGWIWWPMLGLTAAGILSVIGAVDVVLSAYHGLHLLLLLLLYLYLVNEAVSLAFLVWPVSIQLMIQVVVGVAQVWQQDDLGLRWLGERVLDPKAGSAVVWGQNGLLSLRAYGLTDHPNILAIYLMLGMLFMVIWIGTRTRVLSVSYIIASSVFIGSGVALLLTHSRSAWISLGGGVLVIAAVVKDSVWNQRLRNWSLLAGITMLLLSPFIWRNLPFLGMGTTAEMMTARVQERLNIRAENQTLNNVTNRLFAANAVNGLGLGGLPQAMMRGTTDFNHDYQPSRMTILTTAAELGLLGAIFYFALQCAPWVLLWRNLHWLDTEPLLFGLTILLISASVLGLLDAYTWSYLPGRLWQWLVWGLWGGAYSQAERRSKGFAYA